MGSSLSGGEVKTKVVVIGAGPAGLGAAYRLQQYDSDDWLLLDADEAPGGFYGSATTPEGFRFDHSYQALKSRYEYFDKLLESLERRTGHEIFENIKVISAVLCQDQLVPYPIQNHLSSLPNPQKVDCASDLAVARLKKLHSNEKLVAKSLNDYLVSEWGENLSNLFFRPYIYKSRAFPTEKMSHEWITQKIPNTDVVKMMDQLLSNRSSDDEGTDNTESTVRYPKQDGIGDLWSRVVRSLQTERVHFNTKVQQIDLQNKKITTKNGTEIRYEHLISTIPFTSLLRLANREDNSFESSTTFVICLGIRGSNPHPKITGCIYFPEANVIFHRACFISSFDSTSVPKASKTLSTIRVAGSQGKVDEDGQQCGPYWSVMLEVTHGPLKNVNKHTIVEDVIKDACTIKLLKESDEIVSMHLIQKNMSCPLPALDLEKKLKETLDWLKSKDVLSRGRFGAFSQRISKVDEGFIQGVEAVDHILHGSPEHNLNGDFHAGTKLCMPKYHLKDSVSDNKSDSSEFSSASSSDRSSVFSDNEDTD